MLLLIAGFEEPEKAKATHDNYKSTLESYKSITENVMNKSYWEKIEIIDKQTGKKSNFSSLPPLHQHTFILVFSQQISQEAGKLQSAWDGEIKKFSDKSYESEKPNIAKKVDVEKYCEHLKDIRKKFAANCEKFVLKMLEDFKKDITEDEIKIIVCKLKELKSIYESKDK